MSGQRRILSARPGTAKSPYVKTRGTEDSFWSMPIDDVGVATLVDMEYSASFDFEVPEQDLSKFSNITGDTVYGAVAYMRTVSWWPQLVSFAWNRTTGKSHIYVSGGYVAYSSVLPSAPFGSRSVGIAETTAKPDGKYDLTVICKTSSSTKTKTFTGHTQSRFLSPSCLVIGGTPSPVASTVEKNIRPIIVKCYGWDVSQAGVLKISLRPYRRTVDGVEEIGMHDSVLDRYIPAKNCEYGED